jgi:hypothetical protein
LKLASNFRISISREIGDENHTLMDTKLLLRPGVLNFLLLASPPNQKNSKSVPP